MGNREKKITIPLNFLLIEFTPKAINKPSKSIMGVTVNVKVSVKKTAFIKTKILYLNIKQ